ncbi:MAG: radical SAM protein, partial [Lachnospiraceae bacterium]|nr:radical SAM protein [Lachnospiraceae bacterium]
NRLSIGLQSANDEELRILGRIHTYEEFLECYQMAREEGFQNINVDIMTALPGQTLDSLKDTLCKLIELHPEHISAYSLILEEGTPFFEKYANPDGKGVEIKDNSSKELYEEEKNKEVYITNTKDKMRLPGEEEERAMYALVRDTLEAAGYRQYEISNFALPGYESRHNTSYWKRISYLGFGLGASSFIGDRRFRNTEDLDTYLKNGKTKDCFVENIPISEKDAMEETMFLGLRMTEGVDKKAFRKTFGADIDTVYNKEIKKLLADGLIENGEERIRLSRRGVDYGNYVFSRFLL